LDSRDLLDYKTLRPCSYCKLGVSLGNGVYLYVFARFTARIMNAASILVSVVDDDDSVRESLPDLLRELGFASEVFAAPGDFLQSPNIEKVDCLILDISMPGMSGPELRRELVNRGHDIPTIFITAHADFALRSDVREGAADCLIKPFSEAALFEALKRALNLD
jgi:FixJ family two-component response regulator